jgi:penicillin-binding protein 2
MERDNDRTKGFSRRAAVLGACQVSLFGLLAGRMYFLQVVERQKYAMLAEENRINVRLLAPPRGRVFDRFGRELAASRQNYRALVIPEQTGSVEQTLDRLDTIIEIPDHQRRRILRDVARQRGFMPVTVAEDLSWEQFARINANLTDLAGVQPDVGESRFYPLGVSTAHVVGYVSAVSEAEQTGDPLLELPGFRVGKDGVEKVFDEVLRGAAGNSQVEVNAFGRVIRELRRNEGRPGGDVVLTIDADLQQAISRRLADESAACVIMDVETGEILVMVSTPGYDPNAFNRGLSGKAWRSLVQNPRAPLINKTIGGQYPPGSTFKMVVALAGLDAGLVTTEQTFFCNGSMNFGDHRFYCWRWRYGGHGSVNMRQSIEQSCDVYFYELARRVGPDRIAAMGRKLGLGVGFDLRLAGERAGLLPTTAWKQAVLGRPWLPGETLITGIGQGYVLTTPLQLAVMTARIANGEVAVNPRIVRGFKPPPPPAPLNLKPEHLAVVRAGMHDVMHGKRGTARDATLKHDVEYAGKTGTAQVKRISKAERARGVLKNEERPWEERDHGLFVAYVPAVQPRYAIALVIEHGGSGRDAALVSRDLIDMLLDRDPARRPAWSRLTEAPAAPDGTQAG